MNTFELSSRVIFVSLTFVMAILFWISRSVAQMKGPSAKIGKFSNLSIIIFGLQQLTGLIFAAVNGLQGDWLEAIFVLLIVASPYAIAFVSSYAQASTALAVQSVIFIFAGLLISRPGLETELSILYSHHGLTVLLETIALFAFSAVCESTTHICLKKAADSDKEAEGFSYYLALARNVWTYLGVGVFLFEMAAWILILMQIPLSVAFPMTGLQKVLMLIFSVVILRETISRAEWLAFTLIFIGLVLVAYSGFRAI